MEQKRKTGKESNYSHLEDKPTLTEVRRGSQGRTTIDIIKVPIDVIFDIEFNALKIDRERGEGVRRKYERYVMELMNIFSGNAGLGRVSEADPQKLADAVRSLDENILFSKILHVLNSDFGIRWGYPIFKPTWVNVGISSSLTSAIEKNTFDCYPTTTLIADTLTRLGRSISMFRYRGRNIMHVFAVGEEYAFDMGSELFVLPFKDIHSIYSVEPLSTLREMPVDALVGVALEQVSIMFMVTNRLEEALAACNKALNITSEDPGLWYRKANILKKMNQKEESDACLERFYKLIH